MLSAFPGAWRQCTRIVPLLYLTLLCLAPPALAGEVRIGGTGNALGTMRQLAEAFNKSHTGTTVVVLPSMGSSGAIKAVPKGAIEIGVSSRRLTDEESKGGITAVEYARSPTVFAVAQKLPVKSVTITQLVDIYTGKLAAWPDGTPIRPILRQPGDDNTLQIRSLSPEMDKAVLAANDRPGMPFAVTDQEAAERIESIPGALGVSTLALILSEKRPLRGLALNGIEPTPQNIATGRYPLIKSYYLILRTELSAETQEFVKFVQSPKGTGILRANGHHIP